MATRIDKNDEYLNGNDWTRYQQLVLNELERHEQKLNILEKELVSMRLAQARLEMELKMSNDAINKVLIQLDNMEDSLSSKISGLNSEREKMNGEVNSIKWKLAGIASFVSITFTAILQAVVKFFLHG